MKNPSRPYDDHMTLEKRAVLRREAWRKVAETKKRPVWTEKLCSTCRKWNHRDRPEEWCEHMGSEHRQDLNTPNVHVFRPFFHPNLQPGGTWIDSAATYRKVCRLCHKEPAG